MSREATAHEPWLTDPAYGGMSPAAARASWEAEQLRPVLHVVPKPPEGAEPPPVDAIPDCPLGDGSDQMIQPPTKTSAQPMMKSSAEFIAGFTPPDYLLDGILQRRFIYSLTGRTGSGKSALLLLLTSSVALERSIGAHQAQIGRVLYLAGENPDDIRMRWIAMSERFDFNIDSINVHFIPGTFKISEMFARIQAEAERLGPFALVVVDTSAAFFEGDDENSNAQQGAHARRRRSLVTLSGGPCVIVAAHPPKNVQADNLQPRGGGAFIAEMDGNLTAGKEDGTVELYWQGKFRGPDFAPIAFKLETVTHDRLRDTKGRMIPTVVASFLSEAAQDDITAAARTNENKVLTAYAATPGASLAAIARGLGWALRSGDPDKMKVKRAVKKLKDAKLITVERDETKVTDKGKAQIDRATAQTSRRTGSDKRSIATDE